MTSEELQRKQLPLVTMTGDKSTFCLHFNRFPEALYNYSRAIVKAEIRRQLGLCYGTHNPIHLLTEHRYNESMEYILDIRTRDFFCRIKPNGIQAFTHP